MSERRTIPVGIVVFVIFIVGIACLFFYSLISPLREQTSILPAIPSVSPFALMMWVDVLLVVLALLIIPYGFITKKNWARVYAVVFLIWSLFRSMVYISQTGDKTIGFFLFVVYVIFLMYLLMSPVKRYFGRTTPQAASSEETKEFTYGIYTLYSELVRLKNGKQQLIFFFSKHKPKSGSPAPFPDGFEVEVSKRSGLPYLKKREPSATML